MYFKRLKADLKRYAPYSMEEAKATLRSEISNTYLGWIWWILEPLLQMLVYIFVYGFIFKAKTDCYPAFVFIGVSVWRFFTNTLTASVKLIRNSKSLIVKVYIPKFILVLTKLLTNGLKMLLSFVVLIPILIFYRTPITWHYLLIFPMLFAVGLKFLGTDLTTMNICVILLAMPVASNTAAMAERYGGDYVFASACVSVTTLLSVLTVPLVTWLVQLL